MMIQFQQRANHSNLFFIVGKLYALESPTTVVKTWKKVVHTMTVVVMGLHNQTRGNINGRTPYMPASPLTLTLCRLTQTNVFFSTSLSMNECFLFCGETRTHSNQQCAEVFLDHTKQITHSSVLTTPAEWACGDSKDGSTQFNVSFHSKLVSFPRKSVWWSAKTEYKNVKQFFRGVHTCQIGIHEIDRTLTGTVYSVLSVPLPEWWEVLSMSSATFCIFRIDAFIIHRLAKVSHSLFHFEPPRRESLEFTRWEEMWTTREWFWPEEALCNFPHPAFTKHGHCIEHFHFPLLKSSQGEFPDQMWIRIHETSSSGIFLSPSSGKSNQLKLWTGLTPELYFWNNLTLTTISVRCTVRPVTRSCRPHVEWNKYSWRWLVIGGGGLRVFHNTPTESLAQPKKAEVAHIVLPPHELHWCYQTTHQFGNATPGKFLPLIQMQRHCCAAFWDDGETPSES